MAGLGKAGQAYSCMKRLVCMWHGKAGEIRLSGADRGKHCPGKAGWAGNGVVGRQVRIWQARREQAWMDGRNWRGVAGASRCGSARRALSRHEGLGGQARYGETRYVAAESDWHDMAGQAWREVG
jgi:hypothetical protein